MTDRIYIYALVEPNSDKVRYIGQTNNPVARLSDHLCCNDNSPKNQWIKELAANGVEPVMRILCETHVDYADQVESALIQAYRIAHPDLLNTRSVAVGGISVRRKKKARKIHTPTKKPVLDRDGVKWI